MPFIKDGDIVAFHNLNKKEIRIAKGKMLIKYSELKKRQFVLIVMIWVIFFGVKFLIDSLIGHGHLLLTYGIAIASLFISQFLYQGFIMRPCYLSMIERNNLTFEHVEDVIVQNEKKRKPFRWSLSTDDNGKVSSLLCATDKNGKVSKRTNILGVLMVIIFGLVFLGVQLGFIH